MCCKEIDATQVPFMAVIMSTFAKRVRQLRSPTVPPVIDTNLCGMADRARYSSEVCRIYRGHGIASCDQGSHRFGRRQWRFAHLSLSSKGAPIIRAPVNLTEALPDPTYRLVPACV